VLKESNEQYKCITWGPLRFIDSFKFLNSSLSALIDSRILAGKVKGETLQASFPILSKFHPKAVSNPDKLDILLQKIPFPYDMMKDASFFAHPVSEVRKEDFDDRLREESISDDEFAKFRFIHRELDLNTMGEYHDTYLETDVLALMDIMLGFRNTFWSEFEVDPMHCVSMPSIAFHALMRQLQRSKTKVEMLCSCNGGLELLHTLNKNIRGGLCAAFQPYARANNYLCPGYDRRKKMTWITKMDVTSLYPKAMCNMLPMRDFKKLDFEDEEAAHTELKKLLEGYRRDSDHKGSMFTVDLKIPDDKHDFFDLAPAMKSEVPDEWLSEQQVARRKFYGSSGCEKLIPYLGEHIQVTHHIAYLQMLCKLGVEVTKVYHDKCWGFHQEKWLQPFIIAIFRKRQESTDETVRDIMKLEMNSLYGKFLQNSLGFVNTKMYTDMEVFARAVHEPACSDFHVINEGSDDLSFAGTVDRVKGEADVERTHRPTGFTILELSKIVMYELHYGIMKKFYGDRAKLLYMDTDSFMYELETLNPFNDMLIMNRDYGGEFDVTAHNFSEHYKKTLGSLKYEGVRDKKCVKAFEDQNPGMCDEAKRLGRVQPELICEYVATGAKAYAERRVWLDVAALDRTSKGSDIHASILKKLWKLDENGLIMELNEYEQEVVSTNAYYEKVYKKAKGVPGFVAKRDLVFEDYAHMLIQDATPEKPVLYRQFRSEGHLIAVVQTSKRALCNGNDKIFMGTDNVCRPLGHYKNRL
jgi:hypothetical protein